MAVVGNSMGGYGAIKAALTYSQNFGFCAAFCPVIDVEDAFSQIPEQQLFLGELAQLKNNNMPKPLFDIFTEFNTKNNKLPRLYICCGNDDFLCKQNRSFHKFLLDEKFSHTFQQWDGVHGWVFLKDCLEPLFNNFIHGNT